MVASNPSIRHLLVLNDSEPNRRKQAWATPQEAATRWPAWEKFAEEHKLLLVGPQLAYGADMEEYTTPVQWMDAFLAEFRQKHHREPTLHAIGSGYHYYGSDGHGLGSSGQLTAVKKYGKPIWLTEFAHYHAASVEEQTSWMRRTVAQCERDPDASVERYSWFIARAAKHPHLALLDADGALTELGRYYASLPRAQAEGDSEGGAPAAAAEAEGASEGGAPPPAEGSPLKPIAD